MANLTLLANTPTPDLVQHLTERELLMQYYTSMEVYTEGCMENQVFN